MYLQKVIANNNHFFYKKRSLTKIAESRSESGSISQRYGSTGPDPQNSASGSVPKFYGSATLQGTYPRQAIQLRQVRQGFCEEGPLPQARGGLQSCWSPGRHQQQG
jgi:hypothetical protein